MSDEAPTAMASAAELRRRLQELGRDGQAPTRDAAQERAREARMAASIDAELAALQKARRSFRRGLVGFAAAAALLALMLGARQVQFGSRALAIAPEPVSDSRPPPPPLASAAPESEKPAALPPRPSSVPRANSSLPNAPALPSAGHSVEPQSTLAEENQLFKAAAELGRNGDVSAAVAQLDKLLVEHPASPLAQTALVRKFRLLAKAGRGEEARREAERYLATYPTGFAVSEARALQEEGAP